MLKNFDFIHWFYLIIAIILEVAANLLMKLSQGFTYKKYAIAAIIFALVAFTALSIAIEAIPLSLAYSIWGGAGLIATAVIGIKLFDEKVQKKGWIGMLFIITGLLLIKST